MKFTFKTKLVSRIPDVERSLRRAVEEAVADSTEAAATIAYQLTPVSDNNEPGHEHTRDTIHVHRNTRSNYELRAGGAMKYLEFGTSRMAAYAPMRTASEAVKPRLVKKLRRMKVL